MKNRVIIGHIQELMNTPEEMLPLEMLASCSVDNPENKIAPAPRDRAELSPGSHLPEMVEHLKTTRHNCSIT